MAVGRSHGEDGATFLWRQTDQTHPVHTPKEEGTLAIAARLLQTNQSPELRHRLHLSREVTGGGRREGVTEGKHLDTTAV